MKPAQDDKFPWMVEGYTPDAINPTNSQLRRSAFHSLQEESERKREHAKAPTKIGCETDVCSRQPGRNNTFGSNKCLPLNFEDDATFTIRKRSSFPEPEATVVRRLRGLSSLFQQDYLIPAKFSIDRQIDESVTHRGVFAAGLEYFGELSCHNSRHGARP
jgi:hypothetical protein